MLRKIGTVNELNAVKETLPPSLVIPLAADLAVLDYCYGQTRNWIESGGYAVVLENQEDVLSFQKIVDYNNHPCEWASLLEDDSAYLSALYLMNDEYSIVLFIPAEIAPDAIWNDVDAAP